MTCSWCEERFERFLDGDLTPGDHARLLAHVDRCATCHGLLEELRCVDALLLTSRSVELPPDFTRTTMADVQALPAPAPCRAPIFATLVAYIVGSWCLAGAAVLIAPNAVLGSAHSALAALAKVFAAMAGLQHAWNTVAGGVIVADLVVLLTAVAALRAVRPRIAERLRW